MDMDFSKQREGLLLMIIEKAIENYSSGEELDSKSICKKILADDGCGTEKIEGMSVHEIIGRCLSTIASRENSSIEKSDPLRSHTKEKGTIFIKK